MIKPPRVLIVCQDCWDISPEASCYEPGEVWWLPEYNRWVCTECWANYEDIDDPELSVYDVLPTKDELYDRVVSSTTKIRLTK